MAGKPAESEVGVKRNAQPWVQAVIDRAEPVIREMLGDEFVPVTVRGALDELGCGGFGCVMPTSRPGMICKVTLDGTEAFFAEAAMKHGWRMPGLPKWLGSPLYVSHPAPVWLLWREDIPGEDFSHVARERSGALRDQIKLKALGRDWLIQIRTADAVGGWETAERFSEAQQNGLAYAFYMHGSVSHGGADPLTVMRTVEGLMPWARDVFNPRKKGAYWLYADREITGAERAAIGLLAYDWHLEQIAQGEHAPEVAQALRRLARSGMLVADCQPDNLSGESQPVKIRDLGISVPVSPKLMPEWEESRASMDAWDRMIAIDRMRAWERA